MGAYRTKAKLIPIVPNPHCSYTGSKDWRNVKMSASEKPLSKLNHKTIGSVKNI
jgi:hypothetical protein